MSISSRGKLSGAIKGNSELNGSMAMGNPARGAVKSVNGIRPDKNGNVEIEIPECDAVKTVNGIAPDENGNVDIPGGGMPNELDQVKLLIEADMLPAVHDVNGAILTDENGNVILRY